MAFKIGQLVGNRYRILRHYSSGGMSETYLAEDTLLRGQRVALETRRLFSERQRQQVQREVALLQSFNHPNIRHLLDYGTEADISYLVFEYVPDGTLADRHQYGSQVPLSMVVEYVKQVASALQYIHERNIIHRNVTPYKMAMGRNGEVLLTDFSAAMNFASKVEGETTTISGSPSPNIAPEQLYGRPVPASDQYGLGVAIYQWLTGSLPYQGFQEFPWTQSQPPPLLTAINPTIPRDVEQVVLIALEKDPQRRFGNMRAFARAFEQASIPPEFDSPTKSGFVQSLLPTLAPSLFGSPPQQRDVPSQPLTPEEKTKASLEGEGTEATRTFTPNSPTQNPNTPESPKIPPPYRSPIQAGSYSTAPPPQSPPGQAHSNDSGGTGFFTRVGNSLKNLLPRRGVEEQPETQLSLYALASARLEADDRALIGKQYTLEAGLTEQRPDNFVGEPFRVAVRNPAEPLLFHIMLHASPNIQLLGAWYQPLRYAPLNVEPQFITCPFRLNAAGESYLLINFYRERQWLKSIRLEFEGIEQTSFSTVTNWR